MVALTGQALSPRLEVVAEAEIPMATTTATERVGSEWMSDTSAVELTLRDYAHIVGRRKWLVIAATAASIVAALTLSLMQPAVYRASTDVIVRTVQSPSVFSTQSQSVSDPKRKLANEIAVLEGSIVHQRVKADLGIEQNIPAVSGTARADADVVEVSVRSGDAETAAVLADAYVDAYNSVKRDQTVNELARAVDELQGQISKLQDEIDILDDRIAQSDTDDDTVAEAQRRELVAQQAVFQRTLDQRQVDANLNESPATIIRPAITPAVPIEPTPARAVTLAAIVGLMLGLGGAFVVHYVDQTVKRPEDVEAVAGHLPILAVVPQVTSPDNRPIAIAMPSHTAVESYRGLRTTIQFLSIDRNVQVILVTSSVPGEGKSTTAANLATVLAQTGSSVLLVDADLRRPRLAAMLGLDNSAGLVDALLGAPLHTQPIGDGFDALTSGPVPPNPSEMLSSQRMSDVVKDMRAKYDYIVIDSPPTLLVSDPVALSQHVDGVLAVIGAGRVTTPSVRQTLDQLAQVQAPLLGLVLNRFTERTRGRYGYGGYGYGYGYGYAAHNASDTTSEIPVPATAVQAP